MNIWVFYCSHDWITSKYTWVWVLTEYFINSFSKIRKNFTKNSINIDLYLIWIDINKDTFWFSLKNLKKSEEVTKKCWGKVFLINNESNKSRQYWNIINWESASLNSTIEINKHLDKYDKIIIFCTDTPFMNIPKYLNNNKITFLINLHSNYFIHYKENNYDRYLWEKEAFDYYLDKKNIFILKTSEYLLKTLLKNYNINKNNILSLQSGILFNDNKFNKITEEKIIKILNEYNIPTNKQIIFSVWRAEYYKWFDLLIKAYNKVKSDSHLVFIASTYSEYDEIITDLNTLINNFNLKKRITAIYTKNFLLPKVLYQWKNTKLAIQLSRQEPFWLIPEEVRYYSYKFNNNLVILASNKDWYKEQIFDEVDWFLVKINNISNIAKKIDYILDLWFNHKEKIIKNGLIKLKKNYNYEKNLFNLFTYLINNICEK